MKTCSGCGRSEDLRGGVCFDCATTSEQMADIAAVKKAEEIANGKEL